MILKKYFYTVTVTITGKYVFLPELFFIYKSRIVLTYSISGDKRLTLSFTVLHCPKPIRATPYFPFTYLSDSYIR